MVKTGEILRFDENPKKSLKIRKEIRKPDEKTKKNEVKKLVKSALQAVIKYSFFTYVRSKIQFNSHQCFQGYLGFDFLGKYLSFFRILIPRAFTWTYHISNPTNSTADIRQKIILSHLFELLEKKILLRNFEIFSNKYLYSSNYFGS